ncbi:thiamine-phosphate kinase [Alcaligenes faecalis]|uniref:thiamine-phosphate kinase n=1 Tax=Alcaligenes faecalis TaxID=511 RepID=UPI00214FEA37|nr:thiamine-phosphate kinase [Alcaligenes faecalis]
MLNEFGLIQQYFNRPAPEGYLGVGDDCALFTPTPGWQLASSVDLLIEGQHFFPDVDPFLLGHKALAVNLSDLGAMGAKPRACLLALSMPAVRPEWLAAFSKGLFELADQAQCPLIGGDTTRSKQGVVISITVLGEVPAGQALQRSAAQAGDDIWLTGTLGAADIALRLLQGRLAADPDRLAASRPALEQPWPPYRLGHALAGLAHAAIDVSDGLVQDLGHIAKASQCAAHLDWDALPLDPSLTGLPAELQREAVLVGGDVFQLCFTGAPQQRESIMALAQREGVQLSRIGSMHAGSGVYVRDQQGLHPAPAQGGFDHFGG